MGFVSRLAFHAHPFSTAPTTLTMRPTCKDRGYRRIEDIINNSIFSLELHLQYKVVLAKPRFLASRTSQHFSLVVVINLS